MITNLNKREQEISLEENYSLKRIKVEVVEGEEQIVQENQELVEQAQFEEDLKEQLNLEGIADQGKIQYVRDLDGLSHMLRRNETVNKLW